MFYRVNQISKLASEYMVSLLSLIAGTADSIPQSALFQTLLPLDSREAE